MLTQKDLIRIIREELEADKKQIPAGEIDAAKGPESIEDVEAKEGVWSGGENLSIDIDQSEAAGSEKTTKEPETMKIAESLNRIVFDLESAQRKGIPPQPSTLFELYDLQQKINK